MGLSADRADAVPAGQAGIGCSYAFTRHVLLDMGYRFVLMGNTDTSWDAVRLELQRNYMHQIMLGLRVTS